MYATLGGQTGHRDGENRRHPRTHQRKAKPKVSRQIAHRSHPGPRPSAFSGGRIPVVRFRHESDGWWQPTKNARRFTKRSESARSTTDNTRRSDSAPGMPPRQTSRDYFSDGPLERKPLQPPRAVPMSAFPLLRALEVERVGPDFVGTKIPFSYRRDSWTHVSWFRVDGLLVSRRAWWCYLVVALATVPVYFFAVNGLAQRLLFYAYGFSSVVAILVALRVHQPRYRGPWLAFAAGLLLFALGDVAFDVYDAFGHTIPVPSVADYLYLAAYPVLAWGTVLLVRYRVRGADLASALDGVMVAIGVGVLAWVFVMAPYAHDHTLSLPEKVVPIAYPALDLLLVAVIVRLLLSRGVHNASFRLLAASVLALLAADAFFAFASLHNSYSDGNIIDLGWIVSYALWGAAALHPSMSRLTEPAPSPQAGRSRVALAALGVAALMAPITLVVEGLRGGGSDEALLAASSAIMFGLVLARLSLVTRALHSPMTSWRKPLHDNSCSRRPRSHS